MTVERTAGVTWADEVPETAATGELDAPLAGTTGELAAGTALVKVYPVAINEVETTVDLAGQLVTGKRVS